MPQAYLSKGSYFGLDGRAPFTRLIYPVPIPGGAGIHLTLDMGAQARFGPDVEAVVREDYTVDPARAPVFAAAAAGLLDGALRTVLPPLAVLLPGALMVTGLSELAAGAMVAGSSRLMYGTVQLLLFALGVAAAAALLGTPVQLLGNVRVAELGWWAAPLGLLLIGIGITLMEGVPVRLTPWVLGVLVVTFLVQLAGQRLGAPVLGSFLGAAAASTGASVAELVHRQLPRLVVFLPSFWLLVPGSLGLIGVSEVAILPGRGPTVGLDVVGVVLAIATGLLVGSVVSRALGALVGRVLGTPG